ncbi:MAG TPA: ABC transporter permease [Spirochaetia bacterium]|nr:ABC transporter permease [Spirochaetia bacterium]
MSSDNTYRGVNLERNTVISVLARNWALAFLILLFVIFSFTGRGFFSLTNFQNILYLSTTFVLLAAAETFIIISGGIDLSVGFVMGLSSVLSAQIMQSMYAANISPAASAVTGTVIALAVGVLPGLASGILIARYNMPPFIATLGMMGITNGVTLSICQGFPIAGLPRNLVQLGNGYLFYSFHGLGSRFFAWPEGVQESQVRQLVRIFPNGLLLWLIVIGVLWFVLRRTRFGQHTFAIGGSIEAAKRAGINVKRHLVTLYVISSLLASLAGIYNVFQTGVGNYTPFNASYELFAIAAVVIGGASLMGGKGNLIGSVVGVIILAVLNNGLSISGIPAFYRFVAVGIILVIAVVMDQLFPDRL